VNDKRTRTWSVHFAGNTVRFSSDNAGILETLQIHLKYCRGEDGPVVADYGITTAGASDFSVTLNGNDLFLNLIFERVIWHLMQDILYRLNGAAQTGIVFHAAALSYQDDGLILCGRSGSGKSSLAAWLVANGWGYLTDEVILLPLNDREISGFCRSIVLKSKSSFIWQRWSEERSAGLLQFEDGSAWVSPTLLNADAIQARIKPRVLIFPRYSPKAQFTVQPLTTADALFRLLQCLVNARNFSDGGLTATTRLASQVTAYSLTYSDVEGATRWIEQTLPMG
jgi:hypothetical protein